jgi:hypothetical protein
VAEEVRENTMESLEIIYEKHVPWLSEQIEWIRFGECLELMNPQSADVQDVIIKTKSRLLYLRYHNIDLDLDISSILIGEIEGFDENQYRPCIFSTEDEPIRFVKLFYDEDELDGLKFTIGDRYLFIFSAMWNLIVTKSFVDMVDPDDRLMPEVDDSLLFPPEKMVEYFGEWAVGN